MKVTKKTKMTSINNSPPHLRENYLKFFLMTFHLNNHRTAEIKPEMLSGVQTRNGTPHDKYDIRGIAHVRTNRKDDIFMQRRLYIDEAHTVLDIFRFAVFLLYGKYLPFLLSELRSRAHRF